MRPRRAPSARPLAFGRFVVATPFAACAARAGQVAVTTMERCGPSFGPVATFPTCVVPPFGDAAARALEASPRAGRRRVPLAATLAPKTTVAATASAVRAAVRPGALEAKTGAGPALKASSTLTELARPLIVRVLAVTKAATLVRKTAVAVA